MPAAFPIHLFEEHSSSLAVGSGFTPLRCRYLGDYVVAVLADDDATMAQYEILHQAVAHLAVGRGDEASALCRRAMAARPGCAASSYILSLATRDSGASESLRVQATELDPAYASDLSREASGIRHRRRRIGATELRALVARLDRLEPASAGRALAEVAVGQLCAELGMIDEAWRLLDKQTGEFSDHGDLALLIAQRVLQGPDPNGAWSLLERARRFHRTRTEATLLLGDLALRARDISGALSRYEEVAQSAPAWSLPLERMHQCHKSLGNRAGAEALAARLAARQAVIASLPGMT